MHFALLTLFLPLLLWRRRLHLALLTLLLLLLLLLRRRLHFALLLFLPLLLWRLFLLFLFCLRRLGNHKHAIEWRGMR